ncbi:MAG: hypothetical protein J2P28_03720, partial [Actinobacteria bacterium]|nr:hypothetical protein [Actinomycetota bacterium]
TTRFCDSVTRGYRYAGLAGLVLSLYAFPVVLAARLDHPKVAVSVCLGAVVAVAAMLVWAHAIEVSRASQRAHLAAWCLLTESEPARTGILAAQPVWAYVREP